MGEQDREDKAGLSTDEGIHPHSGTRIGTDPGHGAAVDISGGPGGSTGAGAWPKDMGTSDTRTAGQRPKRVAAMLRPRPVSRGSEPSMASLPIAASLPDPWDMATAR
jgi:hypothetical protein